MTGGSDVAFTTAGVAGHSSILARLFYLSDQDRMTACAWDLLAYHGHLSTANQPYNFCVITTHTSSLAEHPEIKLGLDGFSIQAGIQIKNPNFRLDPSIRTLARTF